MIDFDPSVNNTIGRGVGKCCNCGNVIEDDVIKKQAQHGGLGHQLYAVAFKKGKGSLEFRTPSQFDLEGVKKAEEFLQAKSEEYHVNQLIPDIQIPYSHQIYERNATAELGLDNWSKFFNPRQLLTLITYVEIINEAKLKIQAEYEPEKAEAICSYLALVLDRCVDKNCRLSMYDSSRASSRTASGMHSLNLMWNYPEVNGIKDLWYQSAEPVIDDFTKLCEYINQQKKLNQLNLLTENLTDKAIKINLESADSLYHIPDKTLEAIITDPPYYGTIQYAELSDFFYVWQKRILGDIFPDIFWQELTDKDREAVANPSRFRNMGVSADELAKQDYEAKMAMAWNEAYRVLGRVIN